MKICNSTETFFKNVVKPASVTNAQLVSSPETLKQKLHQQHLMKFNTFAFNDSNHTLQAVNSL